jgi:hypothetical protein
MARCELPDVCWCECQAAKIEDADGAHGVPKNGRLPADTLTHVPHADSAVAAGAFRLVAGKGEAAARKDAPADSPKAMRAISDPQRPPASVAPRSYQTRPRSVAQARMALAI